jgi:lactate dehydrogenase-like 2-hydroxyacid dehydrogenase
LSVKNRNFRMNPEALARHPTGMKIGILGGGHVGSALGLSWTRKGHEVLFGVRNPASAEMAAVLATSGGKARAGSAEEAARFGGQRRSEQSELV